MVSLHPVWVLCIYSIRWHKTSDAYVDAEVKEHTVAEKNGYGCLFS